MKTACLCLLALPAILAGQARTTAPAEAPSRISLAATGEPGSPVVIRGVVYTEDGRTPLRSASIYVYQTDARGYYARDDARDSGNPRLKGYLRTDDQGRYEFSTVKPGSYPGTNNPGHIHYHVSAAGHPERVFEIVFEGDPLIPEQWLRDAKRPDAFVAVVRLEGSATRGLSGAHNVILRRQR